jgi:AcrR family transcriptional regulator
MYNTCVHNCRLLGVPRENHRARLVEGALRCLAERGYAGSTARNIAAAAGANLGSIGYHFGSKEALLNEALQEGFRRWTTQVERAVLAADDAEPLERLRISWREVLDAYEENRPLLLAFLDALALAAHDADLRSQLSGHYAEGRQAMAGLIAASAAGTPAGDEPAATILASLLIAIYDGLLVQWILDPKSTPSADELADLVEELVARPVRPDAA